jgi:hypothetical protein
VRLGGRALGVLVDCLINFEGAECQFEIRRLMQNATVSDLVSADLDGDGAVSEDEYMLMKLVQMDKVDGAEVGAIRAQLRLHDKDGDETLTRAGGVVE